MAHKLLLVSSASSFHCATHVRVPLSLAILPTITIIRSAFSTSTWIPPLSPTSMPHHHLCLPSTLTTTVTIHFITPPSQSQMVFIGYSIIDTLQAVIHFCHIKYWSIYNGWIWTKPVRLQNSNSVLYKSEHPRLQDPVSLPQATYCFLHLVFVSCLFSLLVYFVFMEKCPFPLYSFISSFRETYVPQISVWFSIQHTSHDN